MIRLLLGTIVVPFLLTSPALAIVEQPAQGNYYPTAGSNGMFYTILNNIWYAINMINDTILFIGGSLAVLMVVIGGLYYITGHADIGKKIILYTIIGIVVISFGKVIVDLAFNLLRI